MKRKAIDARLLIICTVALSLFGLLMQYSATSYAAQAESGDAFLYVKKQAVSLAFALVVLFAATRVNTVYVKKLKYPILALSVILLALVFIPGLGVDKYGATRWINLGFTTFQPSEVAKFGLIFYIACELGDKSARTFKSMFKILLATLAVCALVMLEPNMSITMCIVLTVVIMLVAGGCGVKQFAIMALPVLVAIPVLILMEPYRLKRLIAFVDPWASPLGEGYQLIQSYYALGSGGLFGVGLFNSRQKYKFLPFAESDFIFSIIGEELGWFGCIAVLAVFAVVVVCGIRIALRASTRLDSYLAAGITAIIAVQTLLNIAVVTGSIPPTGLPLPFISAGGTSLMAFLGAVGLLVSIDRNSQSTALFHKMY